MTLTIDIRHRQGNFTLEATLALDAGLTVIFGPSGSGKTSLINAVAGLIRPQEGTIRFNGVLWSDAAGGHFLPPHRRRIGYVFQEARLFPHMSVAGNLTYGQRFAPRTEKKESLERIAALLRLDHLLSRMPGQLSGGERQRVALGRALMAAPQLLLMDEPLSALDQGLKAQILPDIERIRDHAGIPILYVTHALAEVTRLADRVVAVEEGRPRLIDSRHDLPALAESRPGSFLQAVITGHDDAEGLTLAQTPAGPLFLRQTSLATGMRIRLFLPVSDVILGREVEGALSTLNRLPGTVRAIREDQGTVTVHVDCGGEIIRAEITHRSLLALQLAEGVSVTLFFKAVSIETSGVFRRSSRP
ncbi:molybdenum ABC transporter ATP-binding protein [Rhizobium paknamense]|uniref:Molybdate transport system ATP-binding protein n=1 Tax=Rhizobium paknamense TaxID=1206817 RepID=A0ABU0I9X4_9HYPH|nr:molybdenum ABC transporter ATP-binding protein [Rhizobium paknamense]MDQ0455039.1 molybdate transport system ATP-binding protein [Rhizobium paknamense]